VPDRLRAVPKQGLDHVRYRKDITHHNVESESAPVVFDEERSGRRPRKQGLENDQGFSAKVHVTPRERSRHRGGDPFASSSRAASGLGPLLHQDLGPFELTVSRCKVQGKLPLAVPFPDRARIFSDKVAQDVRQAEQTRCRMVQGKGPQVVSNSQGLGARPREGLDHGQPPVALSRHVQGQVTPLILFAQRGWVRRHQEPQDFEGQPGMPAA
jgi:hypothetical protein